MLTHQEDVLLTTAQVRQMVGQVSVMCLWRWQRDERVQFPAPDASINSRNYWRSSTIKAWQDRMTAQPPPATIRTPRERQHKAA
jgi:predicted DNA-binding transcriptional regulator AlpA